MGWGFLTLAFFGALGAYLIYRAFKYRARNYKITIGNITIMGGTAGHIRRTTLVSNGTTIIYNAIPIEKNFYEYLTVQIMMIIHLLKV